MSEVHDHSRPGPVLHQRTSRLSEEELYEIVARAIANIKTWRIVRTDYRRPLRTFQDTFHAVIGLCWLKLDRRSA